jgi:hypothetical protein
MKSISDDVVSNAIRILGSDGISEDEIEAQVAALVSDPMEARRLVDWIPEAFGMVLVSHLGKPVLPNTFSAKDVQGKWKSFPITCEPIFVSALVVAQRIFHDGPRALHQNIAMRSSIANTANNALNAGVSIDGAVFSGPALIGIPAEVYPKQPSFWQRLFSW